MPQIHSSQPVPNTDLRLTELMLLLNKELETALGDSFQFLWFKWW